MKYRVEMIDYDLIIKKTESGGPAFLESFLEEIYLDHPPTWRNEIIYFWRALFNAGMKFMKVWNDLMGFKQLENIKFCFPENTKMTPYATPEVLFPLPEIGGSDDILIEKNAPKDPSEPHEKNFVEQAKKLDRSIRSSFSEKKTNIKDLQDFVFQCIHNHRISPRQLRFILLVSEECPSLASDSGLLWLKASFPANAKK